MILHLNLYQHQIRFLLRASQVALVIKNPLANTRDMRRGFDPWVPEEPLEEGMTAHSSILAWRIPWTEKPGR